VWPLSRTSPRECLRIGRVAIERWSAQGAGLGLRSALPMPADALDRPGCLTALLHELYADKPQGKVQVVLESAWLPLVLADTGGELLSAGEMQALVRHRLNAAHGSQSDDLAAWDVRADYRAGDRFALGYGFAPHHKQAVVAAAAEAGLQLDAVMPAFLWGWKRVRPPVTAGWWVWPEQDRMLLVRLEAGRVVAFNPAAPLAETGAAIERLVQVESVRWGLASSDSVAAVASWQPPARLPTSSPRLAWHSLAGVA
jgi:hypothetical protein